MPRNFSFIEGGVLAVMGRPGCADSLREDLEFLAGQGIGAIVSLTAESPDTAILASRGFRTLHLPVADFTAPAPEQIDRFLEFVEEQVRPGRRSLSEGGSPRARAVCVHCDAGRGRSGTMTACYLVRNRGQSAEEAMRTVRAMRPFSIETPEQEEAVREFARREAQRSRRNGPGEKG